MRRKHQYKQAKQAAKHKPCSRRFAFRQLNSHSHTPSNFYSVSIQKISFSSEPNPDINAKRPQDFLPASEFGPGIRSLDKLD
jgi:hypothetical protein